MAEAGRRETESEDHGFNSHWFINKEKASEYKCGICRRILEDPQQIVICGHQFCKLCLPVPLKECPTCNNKVKKIEVFSDQSAWHKIRSLKIRCPAKRCKWKGQLSELEEKHKKECPCELVKCTNEGCREHMAREVFTKHVEEECQYKKIECCYCAQGMTLGEEKNHHDNDCLSIPSVCSQCGQEMPKGEIKKHVHDECEKTVVECLYRNVGCEGEIERGNLEDHKNTFTQEHLRLAILTIKNLTMERQKMAEEINELKTQNNDLQKNVENVTETQEKAASEIHEKIEKIEDVGAMRLEDIQKATEQNFELHKDLVRQNDVVNETLMLMQHGIDDMRGSRIAPLYIACQSHEASIRKLYEELDKTRKLSVGFFHHFTNKFAELKSELDRGLSLQSEKHNQDYSDAMEFHEKVKEELLSLDKAVKENKTELRDQKTAFLVAKDDTGEQFRNLSTQMERDYDNLAGMISKEKRLRSEALEAFGEKITQLVTSSQNSGRVLWKIDNVDAALKIAAMDPKKAMIGQAFFSEPHGYKMRPKLFLNGARQKNRSHISIFVQIEKSPNDGALQWPFSHVVRFTLIDQQQDARLRRHIHKDLLPGADSEELRRPTEEANNGYGIFKFVEHGELLSGNYVVDDTMFVRIEVLPNDDHGRHSETI